MQVVQSTNHIKFQLPESFLEPYRKKGDSFKTLLSRATYLSKYSRQGETWTDTIRRVIEGNINLAPKVSMAEAELLFHYCWTGQALPPGRSLWVGGIDGIPPEARYNCWGVTLRTPEDWCWAANQLMLGGGVGVGLAKISGLPLVTKATCKLSVRCNADHADIAEVSPNSSDYLNGTTPIYVVEDSREGWVESLRRVLHAAYNGLDLIIDVSGVRKRGLPIKTFGGIACGPGPLTNLLRAVWRLVRGAEGRRLSSVEALDITNHIGLCIKSGNVRRSALLVLGDAYDMEFRKAKQDFEAVMSHRHTSNNTIMLTSWEGIAKFDYEGLVEDVLTYGEPGIANMALVWKDDPNATIFNPCFAGDTLVAVADGRNAVSIRQLAEEGKDVPVYSMDPKTGKVEIKVGRNPRITGVGQELVRVWLDDGSYLDTTPDHKFITLAGDEVLAKDLQAGTSLPRFLKRTESVTKGGKVYYRVYTHTRNASFKIFEHRLIAKFHNPELWKSVYQECRRNGFADTGGLVVHHKDYNQLNNAPDNLQIMSFKDHSKLHGELDQSGEKNGNWSGVTSEEIKAKALELTRTLGRRFSQDEWLVYAKSQEIPSQFSACRVNALGSVQQLSKLCALELGLDPEYVHVDPRVVKSYQAMLEQGYDARVEAGKVLLTKKCEICGKTFEVQHMYREHAFCSNACGNVHINSNKDIKAKRVASLTATTISHMQDVKTKQAGVCSDLRFKLGRAPNRKEWSIACKAAGIPSRIGPTLTHGYRYFTEVLDAASNYNHKVAKVEKLEGSHTVYNITVDDFHTFGVITKNSGNSVTGVFSRQCGEQHLSDKEACNLAEVFPGLFMENVEPEVVFKLMTRYAMRQRLTALSDPESHAIGMKNMRIGVALGGVCDFAWTPAQLVAWQKSVRSAANEYARELGVNNPITVTTVKPSGCRPWYALTSTSKGLLTLEELFEQHPADQEWAEMPEGVLALQGETSSPITKTYNNGVAKVLRIRMSCGLEVESTENHQWWRTGKHDHVFKALPGWVRSDQLIAGDVLEITPGVYTSVKDAPLQRLNSLAVKMRGDAIEIKQPEYVTPDIAWLFGYLWGDGAMSPTKYRLRFVDQRLDNLEKANRIFQENFGLSGQIAPASGDRDASILEIASKMLWHWLLKNDVVKYCAESIDQIPKCVRSSSQEAVIAFIAGLMDADGGAYGPSDRVKWTITTSVDSFAKHVQDVCWSVGLCCGRSLNDEGESLQKQRNMWSLTSNNFVDHNAMQMLIKHSVKCAKIHHADWYYLNQKSPRRVMGKVESVEVVGEMPTYDIEVADTHWYYAGAVKSHNTISLLNSSSPGMHAPYADYYIRRMRIASNDPMVYAMFEAGVPYEHDVYDKTGNTLVFSFPMHALNPLGKTSQTETLRDQFQRQADLQKYWADSAVSATISFNADEKKELAAALREFVPQLKSTSVLPRAHGYQQAPYEAIPKDVFESMHTQINHAHPLVRGEMDDGGECLSGACPVR